MILRQKYLNLLLESKNNGFPKVITGIRRCGKSFLLNTIYKNYLLENKVPKQNIIQIDLTLISNALYRDPINLYEHVIDLTKANEGTSYVFLDEIQQVYPILNPALTDGKHIKAKDDDTEVITFVDLVLDLASKSNIDLYITGSNSKMLSSDIVTQFHDKVINIRLLPLSFEEFLKYSKTNENEAIAEYLMYGGMPLAVTKKGVAKENYLKELFETTYLKDIIERNKLKKVEALDELCTLLATCVGDLINSNSLAELYAKKTNRKIDPDTINSYLNHFIDSFILTEAFRYDVKGKNVINSTKKYYYIDLGLRNARLNFVYSDVGKMLENLVFNELIYNDYKVNVGTFDVFSKDENNKTIRKSLEIDFLAEKGARKYYIQVCNDLTNEKTMSREIKPYIALNDQITKIVVINRPIKEYRDANGFTIIGLTEFLLRYIKW